MSQHSPERGGVALRFYERWYAAIPTKHEVLEKRKNWSWPRRYWGTIFGFVMCMLLLAGVVVDFANLEPDPALLQTMQVKVLRASWKDPYLVVELPDGQKRTMTFPDTTSYFGMKSKKTPLREDQAKRLVGCMATITGSTLRWDIHDRYRVWVLDCPQADIHVGMDETVVQNSKIQFQMLWFWIPFLLYCFLFFVVFMFLLEKKGRL